MGSDHCSYFRRNKCLYSVFIIVPHIFTDFNMSIHLPARNKGPQPLQQGHTLLSNWLLSDVALSNRQSTYIPFYRLWLTIKLYLRLPGTQATYPILRTPLDLLDPPAFWLLEFSLWTHYSITRSQFGCFRYFTKKQKKNVHATWLRMTRCVALVKFNF